MAEVDEILSGWYAGEVGGNALFSNLARGAVGERRAKWRALASVEAQVAVALAAAMHARRIPVPVPPAESVDERARQRCAAIAGSSWLETMQWLHDLAAAALVDMSSAAARLPAPLAGIGDLVVRHEVALVAFADLELSGRSGGSLQPIASFLDSMR